jgi:tetratricopeptide (TPR) repeat protein
MNSFFVSIRSVILSIASFCASLLLQCTKPGGSKYVIIPLGLLILLSTACKDTPKTEPQQAGANPDLTRLSAMIEKSPANDSLYYLRGYTYWELEAYDEAIADATKAISLDSMIPDYYRLLSDALIDYGRPNDSRRALDVLEKACTLFPDDEHTWLKASEFHLIVKQHGEALKKLDHILLRDPQSAEAYFMTGRVALDMGDTIRAMKSLQKSVQFDAENKDAWIFLGRLYSNKGNTLALQFFDNALRLDSTDVQIQEYKAAFYKQKGDFKKAFELYRGIIVEHQDYSNAWFDMGLIYLEMDSLNQAWQHFDRAIKTDPLFVIAYHYRGVASELKGDLPAAVADYKQANKMSPYLEEPKEALKRLNISDNN